MRKGMLEEEMLVSECKNGQQAEKAEGGEM